MLGFLYTDQGRTLAAREALELAARADQAHTALWARWRLGVLLAKEGEFERADQLLEEVAGSGHRDYAPKATQDLATLRRRVKARASIVDTSEDGAPGRGES
jgi:predicted negative regulator of RcsB-dependent stress response